MGISRRLLAWIVYGGVTLGLALLAVEVAVRVLGLAPRVPTQYAMYIEDAVLPHKLRPHSVLSGRSMTDEFDFRYEHNSLGLRGPEIDPLKPQGSFRILGLGDSFTYGAGATLEHTYLARLEQLLDERPGTHPRTEVINAGIPRFFPEAERLFLEHYGLALQPDLVLVGFVPNDVIDTYLGLEAIEVLPDGRLVSNYGARLMKRLGPLTSILYTSSHALRIPMRRFLRWQMANDRPVRSSEIFRPDGFHEADWQEVERQYALMAELARKHGAGFMVIHLPWKGPWDATSDYPAQRLARFANRYQVGFADPLPAMRASPDPQALFWSKDRHPTDAGHAVIAAEVFEALARGKLVP